MSSAVDAVVTAFRRGDLSAALQMAENEVSKGSTSSNLYHLLGLIHCRQGRVGSGVPWLRRAAETEPENHGFRVMLVRALVDSGDAREALAAATRPEGVSPPELALWHARAEAANIAGAHEASAEAWRVICTASRDDWRAWNNLGEALARLELWSEAAESLRRACEINPDEIRIRRNLASALARAGSYEESASELQKLIAAEPTQSALRLTLARVLADLGRSAEAMAELDRAAELSVGDRAHGEHGYIGIALGQGQDKHGEGNPLQPHEIEAVRDLAFLFERTNKMDQLRVLLDEAEQAGIAREELGYTAAALALRDGDAGQARRLLIGESVSTDEVRWHRLMSKIMDALGDPAAAFAEADEMNRSVHDFHNWRARGAAYRKNIHKLSSTITDSWVAKLRQLRPAGRGSPVFLVGFPRSGTTLLDTFLMGHSQTEVLEEVHMLGAAELVLGRVAELPQKSRSSLEEARNAYFAELDRHVEEGKGRCIIDKLPLNMLGVPVIYSLFPDAKIIFAQRHPCDCVLSGFMQSFVMNDAMACFLTIEDGADLYDAAIQVFTRSCSALSVNVHKLVYEDLVAEPERTLRRLVQFLELEWDERMLDHRTTAKARGAIITPSYDQVVEPLNRKPSGRWRRYQEQLEPVLPVLLPWAERLGYKD